RAGPRGGARPDPLGGQGALGATRPLRAANPPRTLRPGCGGGGDRCRGGGVAAPDLPGDRRQGRASRIYRGGSGSPRAPRAGRAARRVPRSADEPSAAPALPRAGRRVRGYLRQDRPRRGHGRTAPRAHPSHLHHRCRRGAARGAHDMNAIPPTRILVLGGGFGGVYTPLTLEKILKRELGRGEGEIALGGRGNYPTLQPMLPHGGSGGIGVLDTIT